MYHVASDEASMLLHLSHLVKFETSLQLYCPQKHDVFATMHVLIHSGLKSQGPTSPLLHLTLRQRVIPNARTAESSLFEITTSKDELYSSCSDDPSDRGPQHSARAVVRFCAVFISAGGLALVLFVIFGQLAPKRMQTRRYCPS